MFSFEELCELLRVVSETRVGGLEVEREGMRVRIDGVPPAPQHDLRGGGHLLPPLLATGTSPMAIATFPSPGVGSIPSAEAEEGLALVTSPIVGTFYVAPSPDAEPYVKVGDTVHKGQVLCIVEAMKLMNEIEADASGVIVKRFPENGQPVEFGEKLFAIRPA
jgi:acetyl-CoA carboxylase biotin carboxyl carrier protein